MELVNKKKSADESPPANKLMLEGVSDSQTVQYYSFSNIDLDQYNLQLLKRKHHSNLFTNYLNKLLIIQN